MSKKTIATVDFAEFGSLGLFLDKNELDGTYQVSIIAFNLNNSYTAMVDKVFKNLETAKATFEMFKSVLRAK